MTDFAGKNRYFEIPWSRLSPVRFSEVMDPNHLASVIAMTFPVALTMLARVGRKWPQKAAWGSVLILLGGLAITESRAGYLAALVGVASILGFHYRKFLLFCAVGIVASISSLVYAGPVAVLDALFSRSAVGTWGSRKEVWIRAVSMVQDFPLTGIGTGTFGKVVPVLYPLAINNPEQEIPHAHNLYLQVAVDFGIPGLVAFIGLLSASFFVGWRAHRMFFSSGNHLGSSLCVGYLCGLLAWGFHGLLDSPLWLVKPSLLPFFCMGMLSALYQIGQAEIDLSSKEIE